MGGDQLWAETQLHILKVSSVDEICIFYPYENKRRDELFIIQPWLHTYEHQTHVLYNNNKLHQSVPIYLMDLNS
jgi:hypothetical protein